jgi:hypothetical protein
MRILRHPLALIAGLLVAFALALIVSVQSATPVAAVGEPGPGTVIGSRLGVLYGPTALTGSGSANTASPRTVSGVDLSLVRYYYAADIFITADFATSGTLTGTVQFSADGANWADAYHLIDSGSATASIPYRVVITNDGTGYVTVPAAGQFVRVRLDRSASVTPTVNIHLKNTGGN